MVRKMISYIIAIAMIFSCVQFVTVSAYADTNTVAQEIDIAKINAKGKTASSIQVTWESVSGANGYAIFRSEKNRAKNYSKVAEVDGEETCSYIDSDISGTYYYKVCTRYELQENTQYGELSLPVAAKTIDGSGDQDFPKIIDLEVQNRSTILPGTIDMKVKAVDETSNIKYVTIYLRPKGQTWITGSCSRYLSSKSKNIDEVVSQAFGAKSSLTDEKYQQMDIESVQVVDEAENCTVIPYSEFDNDTSFSVSNEFDFSFETVLSNSSLADSLSELQEGSSVLLIIDSASEGVLKKECLDAIKGKDITVVIYCDGGGFTQWVFKGQNITGETKDLNLIVQTTVEDGEKYQSDTDIVKMEFANNGQLPGYVQFRLMSNVIRASYDVSEEMFLYYLANNIVKLENDSCEVKDESLTESWCYFDIDHNSTFLLSGDTVSNPNPCYKSHNYAYISVGNGCGYKKCTRCGNKTGYSAPSYVKSFKVSKGKKCFTAKWKKQSKKNQKKFSGYQIRYSTKSNMSGARYKNIGRSKKSVKIKGLGKKTRYYVQLRTYTGGYYSRWSTKTVVTK